MSRRLRHLLLSGTSLLLLSGGATLAADSADPDVAAPHRLELAQQHQHGPAGDQQRLPDTAPMTAMPGIGHAGTEAAAMGGHDMSPVDLSGAPAAGPDARGGQLLEPTLQDGVKEFALSAGVVRWHILPAV
jgi:hypothetical protein